MTTPYQFWRVRFCTFLLVLYYLEPSVTALYSTIVMLACQKNDDVVVLYPLHEQRMYGWTDANLIINATHLFDTNVT